MNSVSANLKYKSEFKACSHLNECNAKYTHSLKFYMNRLKITNKDSDYKSKDQIIPTRQATN